MPTAIVDLERSSSTPPRRSDRVAIPALCVACVAFAAFVLVAPRTQAAPAAAVTAAVIDTGVVQRGAVLHTLQLPQGYANVDLVAMPERLTNEASPSSLRDVISVRGVPGLASAEGPAVISWSESGVVYWLLSPGRSTSELIRIAGELVP